MKLNQEIKAPEWRLINNICFRTIKDNDLIYLQMLQFKIINCILGTRCLLYIISITDNHYCPFCNAHETIKHFFTNVTRPIFHGPRFTNGS